MHRLFDMLFGTGVKPVRRNVQVRMTFDADGQPVPEIVEADIVTLGAQGGIDSGKIATDRFYHCGCNAQQPMGGQCGEPGCRRVSCEKCYGRCGSCLKPLCLEHTRFLDAGGSQPLRLCRACHGKAIRRNRFRAMVKGVISPFITFDERRKP